MGRPKPLAAARARPPMGDVRVSGCFRWFDGLQKIPVGSYLKGKSAHAATEALGSTCAALHRDSFFAPTWAMSG